MGKLKQLWDSVDSAHKAWTIVTAVVGAALPVFGVRSPKMILSLEIAIFVGLLLSYLLTVANWTGEGKRKCLKRRKIYLSLFSLPLLLVVAMLVILEPDVAIALSAQNIRDFLVSSSILPNVLAFLGGFAGIYLLVGAIVLSSPKVWG